jgi:hypothetical protein
MAISNSVVDGQHGVAQLLEDVCRVYSRRPWLFVRVTLAVYAPAVLSWMWLVLTANPLIHNAAIVVEWYFCRSPSVQARSSLDS